jgi:hypothetical protein
MSASSALTKWKQQIIYVGKGSDEGTMEEAILHFFYDGLSRMIKHLGYKWNTSEQRIALKFIQLCYMIDTTRYDAEKYSLQGPEPDHRNLKEDLETFEFFLDTIAFNEFLEEWSHCPVVGTPFDYLFKEFCYNWIDVTAGAPGAMTQRILEADDEEEGEEELVTTEVLSRRNWSLY